MRIVAVVGTYPIFKMWVRHMSGIFNEMRKTLLTETETKYIHFDNPEEVKSWYIHDIIELYGYESTSSIPETIKAVKLRIEQTKER